MSREGKSPWVILNAHYLIKLGTFVRASTPIFIESKVGAILGERQLRNYVESGAEILVALTKKWPEVPRVRLRKMGVNHLRWQDISRSLSEVSGAKGVDKYMCVEFMNYLECSGMSYREDISMSRLDEIGACLTNIGFTGPMQFVPGSSFEYANACLALLRDARRFAQEASTELRVCRNWGPGYFKECYKDDRDGVQWNALGMEMYPNGGYRKSRLLCAVYFPTKKGEKVLWKILHLGNAAKPEREISEPAKAYTTNGKLDAELLAESIVLAAKKWKPI